MRSITVERRPGAGRLLRRGAGGDGGGIESDACRPATATPGPAPLRRRRRLPGQTGFIFALSVLFAYLFLVALYESWLLPVGVMLSVTVALAGAFGFLLLLKLDNNI